MNIDDDVVNRDWLHLTVVRPVRAVQDRLFRTGASVTADKVRQAIAEIDAIPAPTEGDRLYVASVVEPLAVSLKHLEIW